MPQHSLVTMEMVQTTLSASYLQHALGRKWSCAPVRENSPGVNPCLPETPPATFSPVAALRSHSLQPSRAALYILDVGALTNDSFKALVAWLQWILTTSCSSSPRRRKGLEGDNKTLTMNTAFLCLQIPMAPLPPLVLLYSPERCGAGVRVVSSEQSVLTQLVVVLL